MDGFSWINYVIRTWFWLRVASDRTNYHIGRWIASVVFLIMIAAPFAFQAQGETSWILWPILIVGLAGAAYQIQQLSDRIWHYSGKKRADYEKPNLGPDARHSTEPIFGLRTPGRW